MGTTKLDLWNRALFEIGERKLSSVSENREPCRVLDEIHDETMLYCLEQGQWNFATRTASFEADTALDTAFGYEHVFAKPTDWVRTTALSANEQMEPPLEDYADETDYWLADVDPIYVSYVSSDASYGLDLTRWPATFARYAALELATGLVKRLTNSNTDREQLARDLKIAKRDAKAKDAINEAMKRPPMGRLVRARLGGGNRERGNRGSLIG